MIDVRKYNAQRCERCNKVVGVHRDLTVDDAGDMWVIMGACPIAGFGMGPVYGVPKEPSIPSTHIEIKAEEAKDGHIDFAEPDHFTHATLTEEDLRSLKEGPLNILEELQKLYPQLLELTQYLPKLRKLFDLTK